MFSSRKIERELFRCPEVDCTDYSEYPLVEEIEFVRMETEYTGRRDEILIFPYVSISTSGNPFVELYVWDCMLYQYGYKRYIICAGKRLSEDDEREFLDYVEKIYDDYMEIDLYWMPYLKQQIERHFPEWHYLDYDEDERGMALSHIYFASHRSGFREILFKAGLNYIAYHMSYIKDVNMIGSTPEKIFNSRIPLKLLRILNEKSLFLNMCSERFINMSCQVYKKYSGYIGKGRVSCAQWNYLELIFKEFNGDEKYFNRKIYNSLAKYDDSEIVHIYDKFYALTREMPNIKVDLPDDKSAKCVVKKLSYARSLNDRNLEINKRINARARGSFLGYSDKDHTIFLPLDGFQICAESISLDNCLTDYVESQAKGRTTILFLRKNSAYDEAFVTVEVKNMKIVQVLGAHNLLPDRDVFVFLEKYAKEKNLKYNPVGLINPKVGELENHEKRKGLLEYLKEYKKKRINTENNQMTILGYFGIK